jgi:hypothetical protein
MHLDKLVDAGSEIHKQFHDWTYPIIVALIETPIIAASESKPMMRSSNS